jgi:hypothetical protein
MTNLRGNRPPPGMNPSLADRVAKLQDDMKAIHEALANECITATAGGGAVKVTVNGQQRVVAVEITPEALGDAGLLQDMLMIATNSALEKSQTLAAERLNSLSGGLGLPGFGL